jgi:hypothetical protein
MNRRNLLQNLMNIPAMVFALPVLSATANTGQHTTAKLRTIVVTDFEPDHQIRQDHASPQTEWINFQFADIQHTGAMECRLNNLTHGYLISLLDSANHLLLAELAKPLRGYVISEHPLATHPDEVQHLLNRLLVSNQPASAMSDMTATVNNQHPRPAAETKIAMMIYRA